MNPLFHLLLLSFGLTFVVCDQKADIQCMQNKTRALQGMTDLQMFNLTQLNLQTGRQMAQARANTALAYGLTCYKQFYDNYTQGLEGILITGETPHLNRARTPKARSAAIKALAVLSQAMKCDEDWRAVHFNETIISSICTAQQQRGRALDLFNYRPKLNRLVRQLLQGKFRLRYSDRVMSGVFGELSTLYRNLYNSGEKCSQSMSTPADRCRSLKMFIKELERLSYLYQTQLLANKS